MPEPVQLGAISQSQGSRQVAHLAGTQWLNYCLHPHQGWQYARGQYVVHLGLGAWSVQRYAPKLCRLCMPVPNASGRSLVCKTRQKQNERQARILGQRGQEHLLQSVHCTERALHIPKLPRTAAPYAVQRTNNQANFGHHDQQNSHADFDHCRFVQKPLASGVIVQMDQTALAQHEISRQHRERSRDANLVRRDHLRTHRHC